MGWPEVTLERPSFFTSSRQQDRNEKKWNI